MSDQTNFKFWEISPACVCLCNDVRFPVQTISNVNTWKYDVDETNDYAEFSAGGYRSGAIKTDGTLWMWGLGAYGALGQDFFWGTANLSSPTQTISCGTNWKQISTSSYHSAAIKTDGTLWTWGSGICGALGQNATTSRSSPVQTVAGGTNWKQVSAGGTGNGALQNGFTAAIKTDGTLWTWGNNTYGQLGDDTRTGRLSPVQTIAGGTDWKQVSAGRNHTAAIKTDGTLWMWGCGSLGRMGDNNTVNRSSPVQTISGGTDWKQVSAGDYHTAAVKTDGTLWLWGNGNCGTMGRLSPNTVNSSPVQTVAGGNDWKQVSAGRRHTVAVKTNGTLWTWGSNGFGELGDGTASGRSSPVQTVGGGTTWKQVEAGNSHNIAVKESGSLWTWGLNSVGALGLNKGPYLTTVEINAPVDFSDVFVDKDFFTDGGLWGWGNNTDGQLGDSSVVDASSPVQTVAGGTNWKQISTGSSHTAVVKTDGTLWTWGIGAIGRLGDGTTTSKSSPVQTIAGGTNWKQVSAGIEHTAAVKTDGTLWTWGCGSYGRLGTNIVVSLSSPVQTIAGGTNWKHVSAGHDHTAAVKTDGTLWTWGSNFGGQLGDGTTTSKSSPVQTVAGGNDWKQVSAGGSHTSAIKTDGTLWIWGCSCDGRLGDGTRTDRSSPVQTIAGGNDWKQVSAGSFHTAAVKTNGTLWTWGKDSFDGRLGDGTKTSRSSPVQTISGGTNWKYVEAGSAQTSAIKTDGTLWLWGQGSYGRLGDGTTTSKSSPVQTIAGGTNWKQVSTGQSTFGIRECF